MSMENFLNPKANRVEVPLTNVIRRELIIRNNIVMKLNLEHDMIFNSKSPEPATPVVVKGRKSRHHELTA